MNGENLLAAILGLYSFTRLFLSIIRSKLPHVSVLSIEYHYLFRIMMLIEPNS